MLAHFDGTNGAGPPYTNSSGGATTLGHTAPATGTSLSTAHFKFGTAALSLSGSANVFTNTATSADYNFGTGDFTIEFWMYVNTNQTKNVLAFGNGNATPPVIYIDSAGAIYWYNNNTNQITGANGSIVATTWQAIAVSRVSGSTKMFVGGTQVGSTYSDSNNYNTPSAVLAVGAIINGGSPFNGYIDELRITKGVGRYTGTYTPAAVAFPNF